MNIIIFGPPLAGKGTQSKKIIKDFELTHLSTGDALRAEIELNTELGKKAAEFMVKGLLVPDDLVAKIVERFYRAHPAGQGLLFDGYPRNKEQAEHLLNIVQEKGDSIDHLIFLKVPKEELLKRAVKRAAEENRKDDKDRDTVLRRIDEFENLTIPAFNYMKKTGIATIEIDGNQSIESIYEVIKKELK